MSERRAMCILLCAHRGDLCAARGLVSMAIKNTMGRDDGGAIYCSVAECRPGQPRYLLDATDNEAKRLSDEIQRLATQGGWDRTPVDIYHD